MRRNKFSGAIGLLSVGLGAVLLLGWTLGNPLLTRFGVGHSTIKANSALCLVALGAALLLRERGARRAAAVPGLFVLFIGAITVVEYAARTGHTFDQLVFVDPDHVQAGRMGINTAIAFCLLGTSVILLRSGRRRPTLVAHGCEIGALTIALLALMGYVSGVAALYGPASFTAMAVGTALALTLVALALLASSSAYGLPALVLAPTAGGRMARRLLPVAGVPIVLHALRAIAEHSGLVSNGVGMWVVLTLVVATLVFAVVLVARAVDRAEESGVLLAGVVDSSEEAIITTTAERVVTSWNRGAEQLYGWSAEEAVGVPIGSLTMMEQRDETELIDRAQAGEHVTEKEALRVRRDGTRVTIAATFWALRDASGNVTGYASISRDIGERLATQRKLESLAARLQVSNGELEQFASVASHDLREPLRKIRSFGTLLTNRFAADLPDEGAHYVERMCAAAERMETLINGVLDLSSATRSGIRVEHVSLNEIAREVLDDLQVQRAESGAHVDVGDLPELDADPLQMRQLLQNLIANALKFRRPDVVPEVTVRGAREGGFVELTVADNGIGFEERHAERIFGPFQRLHGRTDYPGAGLGLALCRRIAERHGGSIAARSTPGIGTSFIVKIPTDQPMAEAA